MKLPGGFQWISVIALTLAVSRTGAESFRIATYNLENYLEVPGDKRPAKPPEAKAKIRQSILAIRPDVIVLQELGSPGALSELRDSLKREGLDLSYSQMVSGSDTNIHMALLSKFAFAASRPHTNESFLLNGRRFHVSRGFVEVDIAVTAHYTFTLFAAHLKSKRALSVADEAELRLEEAKLLREKIDARLAADPDANLAVLGDFNDTQDSPSTRTILGRGKTRLVDTRPAERTGDTADTPRRVTWTHYYAKEDSYRRIDYLLLSRGMAHEWDTNTSCVLALPDWGLASDHRPIVAGFEAQDR